MRSPRDAALLFISCGANRTRHHSTGARERRRRRKPGGQPFFLHLDNLLLLSNIVTGWPLAYIYLAEPTVRGVIIISKRGLTIHGASLAGPYLHCVTLEILGWDTV